MKNYFPGFLTLIILLISAGCTKEPEASFVTNTNEYIAGDVVHLTNTSVNGYIYLWALPDGQKVTSTNVDYPIPANQGFDKLTFILTAYSKGGSKSSSISKTVEVIPASVFGVDSTYTYYPFNVATTPYGNNWWIYASVHDGGVYDPIPSNAMAYLRIEIPGTSAPVSSGTYLLQSSDTLSPGYAYVLIQRRWWEDNYEKFVSLSGQLQITITHGKVHAVFNHVDAQHTDRWGTSYPNVKISGDITCH